ncbi:MAG: hypothetical protein MZW92_67510 [Comamonadaceae bacterium]|nr:hypothetical protein [Comamonadaceae bacterium]
MRLARMNGAQALERGDASRAASSSRRRSPSRSCASSPAARSCATPRSSRRCSSLVCRELNNARIAQGRAEISADLLAGSRDTILAEFYERALADQPAGVRKVIEDELLTESGYRESLAEERAAARRSPRRAPRPMRWRSSSTGGCCASRSASTCGASSSPTTCCAAWCRRAATCGSSARRATTAERAARRAARARAGDAQGAGARAAGRRGLRGARGAGGRQRDLRLVRDRARQGRRGEGRGDAARGRAGARRGREARRSTCSTTSSWSSRRSGGSTSSRELAKRAIDYYGGLPPELRNAQSERNRALALVRYGTVLRTQARLDEARKAIDEAVQVLGGMRDAGDRSETTLAGLALGLSTQARIVSSVNDDAQALVISARASRRSGRSRQGRACRRRCAARSAR